MSTANSRLKIDFGFDSYGSSNVEGDFNVSGNVTINGTVLSSISTTGDLIPVNNGSGLGNNTNRWTILANSGNFTNTLTVAGATSLQDTLTVTKTTSSGNVTILGFANATGVINAGSFSVGSSLLANSTGIYHSGTINSASFSTSGLLANSTALVSTSNTILLGNSTGRFVVSANSGDFSGLLTVSGNTTLSGNATLSGDLQTISGNVNIDSGTLFVDSVNNRVGIGKTNPNAGLDISGSANISTSVNSALFTVGTSFIANTSGAYHTGTVNATSHTVGSNFIANSSTVAHDGVANLTSATSTLRIGNSSVNTFVNSSVVATSTGNFSTGANVGSNVNLVTSGINIGNSTVNVFSNSTSITLSGTSYTVNVNSSGFSVGSFSVNTSILSVNTGNFVEGANVGANVRLTTTDVNIGNSTVNVFANSVLIKISNSSSTANLSPLDLKIGSAVVNSTILTIGTGNFSTGSNVGSNVNLTTTGIQIGNSTVNTQVNSSVFSTGTGNFSLAANVGANVSLTTVILSIGNSTVNSSVNSTVVSTGTVNTNTVLATTINAASYTVGSNFIANSTTVLIGTSGRLLAGLASSSSAVRIDAATDTNGVLQARASTAGSGDGTTTVTVTRAVNSGANDWANAQYNAYAHIWYGGAGSSTELMRANTTGLYHTGTINAASHTVGSSFIANSTQIITTSNTVTFGTSFYSVANGNLGIGTASPGYRLQVVNSTSPAIIGIDSANDNSGAGIAFLGSNTTKNWFIGNQYNVSGVLEFTRSTTNGGSTFTTPDMVIDSSGNVGVGTTSPSTYGKFVAYSSGGYGAIDSNGFLNCYQLLDTTTAGGRFTGGSNQGVLGSIAIEQTSTGSKGGYIVFKPCPSGSNVPTEAMRIDSNGNVLIGATVNAASHTVGSSFIANSTAIVGTGYANVATSVNSALLTVGTSFIATTTGAYHTGTVNAAVLSVGSLFIANSSTTYSNNRVVGYGAMTTGSMLNASGSLGAFECTTASGTANAAFMAFHRQGAYASYFGIDTDNQFAVGGWSAGAALANMKVGSFGVGTAASGTAGEIRATNNITAYYSDKRLKENIKPIANALEKLKQISGVTFNSNEVAEKYGYTDKKTQVGVIAQEVEKVLPEVVVAAPFDIIKNDQGEEISKSGEDYKTVHYDKLVPLLIEAIKEQQKKIEELEYKINNNK